MSLFKGGSNCCYRHVVHHLLFTIVPIYRNHNFQEYLEEDLRQRLIGTYTEQEDAGNYLCKILESQRWLSKLWNRECNICFMETKTELPEGKVTRKRSKTKDQMIIVYPNVNKSFDDNILDSISIHTEKLTIVKRPCHPPPRYLLISLATKIDGTLPLSYFEKITVGGIVFKAIGYVLHLGTPGSKFGHYIFMNKSGLIYDDLQDNVMNPPSELKFNSVFSPTLILYQRVTLRTRYSKYTKH